MDLYFAGECRKDVEKFISSLGVNRLHSFISSPGHVNRWLDLTKDCPTKFFLDSGAYSAHTKGKEINVDEYIARINELDERLTLYAQLDTIPGEFGKSKTLQQLKEAPELSWENYLYMRDRVASRDKLVPVFHQGENFKHLKRMLEFRHEDGSPIKYIGISPANDVMTQHKDRWFNQVFGVIQNSSNPNVKTHAFGMTCKPQLEKYPFTSADSTSWIVKARFGCLDFENMTIVVSDRKTDDPLFYKNLGDGIIQRFEAKVMERGLDLEQMMTSCHYRCKWEALELVEWLKNYEYKGRKKFQKRLF
jgi:hypothetical protein